MRDKRLIVGFAISAGWIALAVFMLFTQERPTKLNEWGDYIAGFSAPLAFFWLVLGYLQQGEELKNNTEALKLQADELKHSTEALRLQAEELRNSVEQQSRLVAVSREQMALDKQVIEEERERLREHARPRFVARRASSAFDGLNQSHTVEILNVGNIASDVTFRFSHDTEQPRRVSSFARDAKIRKAVRYVTDADYTVQISYTDADGVPGITEIEFQMTREEVTFKSSRRII